MSESTTTPPAESTPQAAGPAPALHLLPLSLGRLAVHADRRGTVTRFPLGHVRVKFGPGDTFTAEATDSHALVRIAGPCAAPAEEYPSALIPALGSAPNGSAEALVPVAAWRKAFAGAKQLTRKAGSRPVLQSLAVVTGEEVTTMAATDTEANQCDSVRNGEGRFPPTDDILGGVCEYDPVAEFDVDPRMLAEVLKTAAEFWGPGGGDVPSVTVRVFGKDRPVLVTSERNGRQLTAIVMPLAR